jgi:hypothetical protein
MASIISPVDEIVLAAPLYAGKIGRGRPAQNQVEADAYDADISIQGMGSLLPQELEPYKP